MFVYLSFSEVSSSPDDDLTRAIKLSLQDSGLPPAEKDGSGHTDSSSQSHQSKRRQDSDSDSECDFCF